MKEFIILQKSTSPGKKYMVLIQHGRKTVHFGASGYSDFTIHKDPLRKKRYEIRHQSRENWGRDGINTAGFWARWLLWNKPTLKQSIKDIEKRFNLNIIEI